MTKSISWYILGGLSLIAGFFAFLNPAAATFATETLTGASFLAIGLLQFIGAFRQDGWKARTWASVIAVAFIALGVSLLANPLAGIVSLTILTATTLFVAGLAKVFMAGTFEDRRAFWAVMISGILSLVLSLMILFGLPGTFAITLGLFLACELISTGVAMITIGINLTEIKHLMTTSG